MPKKIMAKIESQNNSKGAMSKISQVVVFMSEQEVTATNEQKVEFTTSYSEQLSIPDRILDKEREMRKRKIIGVLLLLVPLLLFMLVTYNIVVGIFMLLGMLGVMAMGLYLTFESNNPPYFN